MRSVAALVLSIATSALALSSLAGCKLQDDKIIGRYKVEWTRVESCGDSDLLASPDTMRFNIALRDVGDGELQWIDRSASTVLHDAGDGTYQAQLSQVVDARSGIEGADELPECLIERVDTLAAVPEEPADDGSFDSFSADLTFDYANTEDSSCGEFLAAGGFTMDLPCSVAYEGVGSLVE